VGGNEWNFWQRIKASPWYRRQQCEGPERCPGSSHTCGDATPIFNQFVAEFREKQCFAYAHSWEGESPMDTVVSTVNQEVSLHKLKAKVVTDFFTFLAQYKSRNILISFTIHPDHVFLVEFDSGSFRIYQSWMNSFDLQYWSGVDKDICEKDEEQIERIRQARQQYGSLKSLTFVDMNKFLTDMAEILSVSNINGELTIPPGADMTKWLGNNVIGVEEIQKYEGYPAKIIICYVIGPEVSPPRQRLVVSTSPRYAHSASPRRSGTITIPRPASSSAVDSMTSDLDQFKLSPRGASISSEMSSPGDKSASPKLPRPPGPSKDFEGPPPL